MCRRRVLATLALGLIMVGGCSTSEQPASQDTSPLPDVKVKPTLQGGPIKTDKFAIVHSLSGNTMTVSLDTDLPDLPVQMSVSRSYFEKNSTDELARKYFEENSTVGRWRQPRQLKVSHDIFKTSLPRIIHER